MLGGPVWRSRADQVPLLGRLCVAVQAVIGEGDRDLVADVLVDGVEGVHVILARQAERRALGADPGRAADPVDVVLGVLRQVVVDDVADALDVQPPARHIGRDQDRQGAVAEVVEHAQALGLHDVAGEGAGGVPVAVQLLDQAPSAVPGVDEDHGAGAAFALQQADQQRHLLPGSDVVQLLPDSVRGQLLGVDDDLGGVVHLPPPEGHHPR
ncbi:MAG: hypothetical protein C3F15_04360 [Holophagae bacterium]|nr:MAG: hypothetical protein C3F15_04360 [Holophagae bacterium]